MLKIAKGKTALLKIHNNMFYIYFYTSDFSIPYGIQVIRITPPHHGLI